MASTVQRLDDEAQANLQDPAFWQKVLENLMNTFVCPYVKRRQDSGELPVPFVISAAKVLLPPDERPIQVTINNEVTALADMRLRPESEKGAGDLIFSDDLEWFGNFRPTEDDDPNCGYIIMLMLDGRWYLSFSFIYNKALSLQHLELAKQFLTTAEFALANNFISVFVDNLFSANELSVKALMLGYRSDLRNAKKHTAFSAAFNQFANFGNVEPVHQATFNSLSIFRRDARYMRADVDVTVDQALEWLASVRAFLAEIEGQLVEVGRVQVRSFTRIAP